MTIYVGNLSFQAEQEDLLDLFGQYGEVKQCSLPLDRETGRKRGFAFVEMSNDADEQKAIDDLQDVEWMGRMIRVNKATPREGGGGGGGREGGRGGYGGGGGREGGGGRGGYGGGGGREGGGGGGYGGGGRGGDGGGGSPSGDGGGGGGYDGGGGNRW
jgi:RNA recognition motif-containing protein